MDDTIGEGERDGQLDHLSLPQAEGDVGVGLVRQPAGQAPVDERSGAFIEAGETQSKNSSQKQLLETNEPREKEAKMAKLNIGS